MRRVTALTMWRLNRCDILCLHYMDSCTASGTCACTKCTALQSDSVISKEKLSCFSLSTSTSMVYWKPPWIHQDKREHTITAKTVHHTQQDCRTMAFLFTSCLSTSLLTIRSYQKKSYHACEKKTTCIQNLGL